MLSSKLLLVLNIITAIACVALVVFQVLEASSYSLSLPDLFR